MCRTITSLLTATVVLVHAVIGCCWHSHGQECCRDIVVAECSHEHSAAEHGCKHSEEADCGHDHANSAPADSEHEECEHGECSYVATESPAVVIGASLDCGWVSDFVMRTDVGRALGSVVAVVEWNHIRFSLPDHDPARARARLSVWVV
jgi:hypothetical protein